MKYLVMTVLLFLGLNVKGQISNPYDMLYYPINYDSLMSFICDSSKYNTPQFEDSYLQSLGTLYSFVGNYNKSEATFITRNTKKGYIPTQKRQLDLNGYGINQDTLNKLYVQYNVVLFNEAHHISRHRAFLYSQLEILKELGFTKLAIETLNQEDKEIDNRKYPINNYPKLITGVYTNDPVFGNLIRKAIDLGFELIPYESYKLRREKTQAKNIYTQHKSIEGKLIVYAGYGHTEKKFPMMGYHLQKILKEELLSISQVTQFSVNPVFPDSDNNDFYLQKDSIGRFDYHIYFKPKDELANIPYWYKWMNFKTKKLNEIIDEPVSINSLIQLYNRDEINGVPVYQYLNETEDDIYITFPKSGVYILKIFDKDKVIEKIVNL